MQLNLLCWVSIYTSYAECSSGSGLQTAPIRCRLPSGDEAFYRVGVGLPLGDVIVGVLYWVGVGISLPHRESPVQIRRSGNYAIVLQSTSITKIQHRAHTQCPHSLCIHITISATAYCANLESTTHAQIKSPFLNKMFSHSNPKCSNTTPYNECQFS